MITDPARVGVLYTRSRRLQGPYLGQNHINGIFPDRIPISFAGLFTYKHLRDGRLVQHEEPQGDLSALLRFEPGSTHVFNSIRTNPDQPSKTWRTSATYMIEAAQDVQLGACTYRAVRVRRDGTLTMPDGEVKPEREDFIFLPELLLKVEGTGVYFGAVTEVRMRRLPNAGRWPFVSDAAEVLQD